MEDDYKFSIVNKKEDWEKGSLENLEFSDGKLILKNIFPYELKRKFKIEAKIREYLEFNKITDVTVSKCGTFFILLDSKLPLLTYDFLNDDVNKLNLIFENKSTELKQNKSPEKEFNNQNIKIKNISACSDTLYLFDDKNRILAFSIRDYELKWIVCLNELIEDISKEGELNPRMVVNDSDVLFVLINLKNKSYILSFTKKRSVKVYVVNNTENSIDICVDSFNFIYLLEKQGIIHQYGTKKIIKNSKNDEFSYGLDGSDNDVNHELGDKSKIDELFSLKSIKLPKINLPTSFFIDIEGNFLLLNQGDKCFFNKISSSGEFLDCLLIQDDINNGKTDFKHLKNIEYIFKNKENNLYLIINDTFYFLEFQKDIYFLEKSNEDMLKGTAIQQFVSKESSDKWHKIVLDGEIPFKTLISLYYYFSDYPDIENNDLSINWTKIASFEHSTVNLRDALIGKGSGKYLWIKVELISKNKFKTPEIRSMKLFYRKNSYLRYLPAIYQEDKVSKDFLERFLSLFETFFWNQEEKIKNVSNYFDPDSTPSDFLPWLGKWTSTVLDDTWPDDKKREFLKRAVELYKIKGTKKGIEEIIGLYTSIKPIIIENWQLYKIEDDTFKAKYDFASNTLAIDSNENLDKFKEIIEKNPYLHLLGEEKSFKFHVILIPFLFSTEIEKFDSEVQLLEKTKEALSPSHTFISENYKILKICENQWIVEEDEEHYYYLKITPTHYSNLLTVHKCNYSDKDPLLENKLNRIIRMEKPAHTLGKVSILKQAIYLDHHTYIGVNSILTERKPKIGSSSIIGDMVILDE